MYSLAGLRTRIAVFIFFFLCLAVALFLTRKAHALDNPEQFFDYTPVGTPQAEVLGIQAFAQGATSSATAVRAGDYHNYQQHNYFLGFVGDLTPSNPFYFMKRFEEGTTLALTFNTQARERERLEFAGERLTEIQQEVKAGNASAVASIAQDYKNTMTQLSSDLKTLKAQGQDVKALTSTIDTEAAKQTLVLEEVAHLVPKAGEAGIKTALAACEKTVDVVADVLGKPSVPAEVVTRIQSLKALGVVTPEEATKLIASSSREQAREELRKYADAGIFPQADLAKLNETARTKFPDGYFTTVELKKFDELKTFETGKPDPATLKRLQDFAKDYKQGDIVPSDLRRWWVPLVRLEELQRTIRPDLIKEDFLRNKPEDQQKYKELVERIKPTAQDIQYVNGLISKNPNLLNDPSYARLKAIADKFGAATSPPPSLPQAQTCGSNTHWVTIPFMPNGGYCVPNYNFPSPTGGDKTQACPPGYHRPSPDTACFPDNPSGPGVSGELPAAGTCYAGYHWVPEPTNPRGGYCSPNTVNAGGGFPSPLPVPGYCLPGQVFRDGKCAEYNPPPTQGCPSGQYWNGQKCIAQRDCGAGSYQDYNGECRSITDLKNTVCAAPPEGCGFNAFWDSSACTCKSTFGPKPTGVSGGYPTPPPGGSCTQPAGGCPSGWYWNASGCSCNVSGGGSNTTPAPYGTPSYQTPSGGDHYCGSGYYWNGSYCAPSSGGYGTPSYGTPSGTYGTPTYGTPSGTYGTPSYGTPEYPTPSYGTPSYPTPSYGTPSYPTPSYGTPSYGTPSYGTPSGTH